MCASSVNLRDSGENFGIYGFLEIFRRKINGKFSFMKRIGMILTWSIHISHIHVKSYACNLRQEEHRVCVISENFARLV